MWVVFVIWSSMNLWLEQVEPEELAYIKSRIVHDLFVEIALHVPETQIECE